MAWEAGKCPSCGNYDSLVPLPSATRLVTWAQHGGAEIEVRQYRCLACGARDIIQRDFAEKHKDDKPLPGHFAEADGRMFVAQPNTEEA